MTHGWPGSVIELPETARPAHRPAAHMPAAPRTPSTWCCHRCPATASRASPRSWAGSPAASDRRGRSSCQGRLGYTRYVAQGGDEGAAVTDAMGRQAPAGLLGIHINLAHRLDRSRGQASGGVRAGTLGARRGQDLHDERLRVLPRAVHPAADDRYSLLDSPVGLAAWLLDHDTRQLLQGLPRVPRQRARRKPHPRERRRQHHVVLAHGHGRLVRSLVLGDGSRTGSRPDSSADGGPGRLHDIPGRDIRGPAQLGRGGLPRPCLLQRGRSRRPLLPP